MGEAKLTRQAYEKLIEENIEAIMRSNMTPMEASHTICVLRDSVRRIFQPDISEELTAAQQQVAELEREVEKLKQNSCDLRTALLGVVSLAVEREQYPESYWQYKFTDETRQRYERIIAANEQNNLTADNARLREAIQSVLGHVALPARYREELEDAINE